MGLHLISTFVLVVLCCSFRQIRQRENHLKLLSFAFAIDLGLVLYIELTRHAVETVVTQVRPLVWFHAAISTAVLVAYAYHLVVGWKSVKAQSKEFSDFGPATSTIEIARVDRLLLKSMCTLCCLRMLNYVTAFMI